MRANRLKGGFDRRVILSRPDTVVNDFNEQQTSWTAVRSLVPAEKTESNTGNMEKLQDNQMHAESQVIWHIRWLFAKDVKANWRLTDQHDGRVYEITAPAIEIGRRQYIKLITRVIE